MTFIARAIIPAVHPVATSDESKYRLTNVIIPKVEIAKNICGLNVIYK